MRVLVAYLSYSSALIQKARALIAGYLWSVHCFNFQIILLWAAARGRAEQFTRALALATRLIIMRRCHGHGGRGFIELLSGASRGDTIIQ